MNTVDPVSAFVTALEVGSTVIKIGKFVGDAVRSESPKLAYSMGTAMGSLITNVEEAERLLRMLKKRRNEATQRNGKKGLWMLMPNFLFPLPERHHSIHTGSSTSV